MLSTQHSWVYQKVGRGHFMGFLGVQSLNRYKLLQFKPISKKQLMQFQV
uniref:Uncharacterized protein n=1 Tax=Anguilla anguilla TaxID=7936 RepID=A0A0E9PCE4_ANGAN